MMNEQRERLKAVEELLSGNTTSGEKLNSIKTLIKGIHPKIDNLLESCAKTLASIEKIQNSQIVELTAENFPEQTEEEKRRKKALLLFIKNWNALRSEVKRVQTELAKSESKGRLQTSAKIIAYAKGPFGLITVAALLIAGFMIWQARSTAPQKETIPPSAVVTSKPKIKVIEFNGKKIPLTELAVRTGPDCDSPHYHAANHVSVKTLDGSVVLDPGSCAFGKVKDVSIIETSF